MSDKKTGVVERFDFTFGSAGHQWTYIDGFKYATYWDMRTKDWLEGDTVEFDSVMRPLWSDGPKVPHAENIRKVKGES